MSAMRPMYDSAYGTDALDEITAAQLLPDDQSRGSAAEVTLIDLRDVYAPEARLKWQLLKSYIEMAFPTHSKPKLEAAGWKHYTEAVRNNWEELNQLMAKGASFLAVAENVTALTAGNNMPAGFVADFSASREGFDAQYLSFMNLRLGQPAGTVDKIGANNAIYRKAIRLSKDAPLALANKPERYNKLVFAQVLAAVSGGGGGSGFEQVYTIAAGANLTVNEFLLVEGVTLEFTLMTDATPVLVCRNVLSGCGGDGKLLIYNTVVQAVGLELPGNDNQLVMTNTTAVEVMVKVKVL